VVTIVPSRTKKSQISTGRLEQAAAIVAEIDHQSAHPLAFEPLEHAAQLVGGSLARSG